jgi:hypothetical protein
LVIGGTVVRIVHPVSCGDARSNSNIC